MRPALAHRWLPAGRVWSFTSVQHHRSRPGFIADPGG